MLAEMLAHAAQTQEGEGRIIPSADGLPLYVHVWEPVLPVTGLPVVCLHGLTRNGRDFELVGPRIAALGRKAIAIDVRGRGRSAPARDAALYTPVVYAQDTLTVLDRLGIGRAVFVGTSMGGIVTMVTAASAPERVAAAILNDVGPVLEAAGYARIGGYVGKAMEYANAEAALAAVRAQQERAYPNRTEQFWATFLHRVARTQSDGRVTLDYDPAIAAPFQDGAAAAPDMTQLFEAVAKAPVLVVRGALSDLLSADGVELMRLVKPDLDEAVVADVGHAPTLEERDAWLAIVDFLARVD